MSADFMIDIDVFAADGALNMTLSKQLETNNAANGVDKSNYLRMQTFTDLGMDKVDKASIDGLIADGNKMWEQNKEAGEKIIRDMCDEKFGSG
mmetsp:Transcript_31207/g.47789  ORF Transcript_31207/g.47789 Transcript_31207/m.47789 type:complete len:93 (-) Transcript_31207:35-313(-)